jgi:nucleotide-binding universal stress UspA family protein
MSNLPEYQTILYATDLGKHTRPVFRHAVSLAKQFNAQIVMLHVVEPIGSTGQAVIDTFLPNSAFEKIEKEGMQHILERMKQRLHAFCEEEHGVCVNESDIVSEVEVVMGHPSEQILLMARNHNADIIVIGSCNHSMFGRSTMGATARQVSNHARIPVLCIPNC